jgi:arylsulfatase A-like enzyme
LPNAGIGAHLVRALTVGLGLGVGIGLIEVAAVSIARSGRGLESDIIILIVVANVLIVGALASLLGLITGMIARHARSSPQAKNPGHAYTVAGALVFPPVATWIWLGHHPSQSVTMNVGIVAVSLIVGFVLARVIRQTKRPGFHIAGLAVATMVATTFIVVSTSPSGDRPEAIARGISAPSSASEGELPTNVLLVTIDTLRYDFIGACGDQITETPTMDALARDGVIACRTIVPQPNSNAMHASLLSGLYPNSHGSRFHMVDRMSPDVPTLGEILREHGYQTGGIFSWISFEGEFSGLDRGFDTYQGYVVNLPGALDNSALRSAAAAYRRLREYVAIIRTSDMIVNPGDALEESIDGQADVTTDAALRWFDQLDERPFFLWLHYFDPHYPYSPPPPYDTMYESDYSGPPSGDIHTIWGIQLGEIEIEPDSPLNRHLIALYRGEITYTDAHLGRVIEAIDSRGLADNTLVIVTGDHGESFGENSQWFHSHSLHNSAIQVPLIMRMPGRLPVAEVMLPVSSIDIKPTILDLLGFPTPPIVEGVSILPIIEGRENGADRLVFSQTYEDRLLAVVSDQWKLIVDTHVGTHELYDLRNDPSEEVNLAPAMGTPAATDEVARVWHELSHSLRQWAGDQRIYTGVAFDALPGG